MNDTYKLLLIQRLFETGFHLEIIVPPENYRDMVLQLVRELNEGRIQTEHYCREMKNLIELYNRNLLLW